MHARNLGKVVKVAERQGEKKAQHCRRMYLRFVWSHTHIHIEVLYGIGAGIFHITMATTNFWPKASVKGSQQGGMRSEDCVGWTSHRGHAMESRKLKRYFYYFIKKVWYIPNRIPQTQFHAICDHNSLQHRLYN